MALKETFWWVSRSDGEPMGDFAGYTEHAKEQALELAHMELDDHEEWNDDDSEPFTMLVQRVEVVEEIVVQRVEGRKAR